MAPRVLFCRANPIAPDPRVEKEAAALAEAGYSVSAVAWDQTGVQPANERKGSLVIERINLPVSEARGLGNLPYILRWQSRLLDRLVSLRGEYDVVHACDFDTVLPALLVKWLWGKRVIYDIFDFYADMLRITPGWIVRLLRKAELWAINRVDAVILPDDTRYRQIEGSQPRKSIVIYNSPPDVDSLQLDETDRDGATCLQLAYVGNLQVERGLVGLIEVLKIHPEWNLDLAGFGPDEDRILTEIAGMPNVHWFGRVPYERALELNRNADVLVALYDPAVPNHRYASPNKVFEAMMLTKPIIAARRTNVDQIITKANCGLLVDYGDVSQLEAALTRLASEPALRAELGGNGRKAYLIRYSWEQMRIRLVELYREVAA